MNYEYIKNIGPFYVLVNLFSVNIAVFVFISLYEFKSSALLKTVEANNQIILDKNKSINRSIAYAKQIQTASLPKSNYIDTLFSAHYIYNRPKDVISGDFYAAYFVNDHIIFICADCTGHGIPGAMLNTFGITSLNQIILEKGIIAPNLIVHELSLKLKYLFQSDQSEVKDGMDLAIISINNKTLDLSFFGAGRNMFVQRQLEMIELKKQTYGIGGAFKMNTTAVLPNQIFKLEKNDLLYLFTDGIIDQTNSVTGKKLSTKTLIQQLQAMASISAPEKEQHFHAFMNNWISDGKQIDDMLFICLTV
jgi:phosphoserine phosphatase RsbU/P